jgi:hypothetical protein
MRALKRLLALIVLGMALLAVPGLHAQIITPGGNSIDSIAGVTPTMTTIGSVNALEVAISHALATYGYIRTDSDTFDGVNDEVTITGGGGQVCFEIPSGLTGTVVYEARFASGSWVAVPVIFDSGAASTFPARGCFTISSYPEYRARVTVASSGSTTAVIGIVDGTSIVRPEGTVAHDAVDQGNPVKIGAKAHNTLSTATLVAHGDRTDVFAGLDGVLIVRPHANLEDRISGVAAITDGSSTSVISAQSSGIRSCITTVIISNSSATNVTVDIRDGTGGSVLATFPAAANMGGAVANLPVPLCGSDATALAADPSASASTVAVTLVGFKTNL